MSSGMAETSQDLPLGTNLPSFRLKDAVTGALVDASTLGTGKKGVLVDFWATWCPPCMSMKHDVWPAPAVAQAIADGYLAVQVDTDRDQAWAARYNVDTLPTVLLLDVNGREVTRHVGYLSASGVVRLLTAPR